MLDYLALAAVAAVLREGSFDKAAAVLGITPSAVSQRVKGLEERLGVALVTRGAPCLATPIGARLCAHVERVRLLEADISGELQGLAAQGDDRPTLRVAVNSDSLATWFPLAAAQFTAASGALLELVLDDEAHTAERLRTGEVMAAVSADPAPVAGCKIHPLGALDYAAVASPAFHAAHFANGLANRNLRSAPMLRFDRRDELQFRWMREAHGEAALPPTHWAPSTHGMLELTLAGLGWSMAPVSMAAPWLAQGLLVELEPLHRIAVPLNWQRTRLNTQLLDVMTGAVRQVAAQRLRPLAAPAAPESNSA
ncbi:LysR family transcriptional regulator ArgP [Bosea sp. ASV33]|uniref:LysR family transcriptional regulator ArgP n=1 Tax=Bosea sp. ASV33 TaxID=2795106 RepID=UPI0018EBF497|nr:LysR family transcriptional regulator ArgP [Bosea sp. ASV33]